jgi:hypothetical protein
MKSDLTTTVLNFVLAALVILGVVFAILAMQRTSQLRGVTPVAMQVNSRMMMVQSLLADVNNYNAQAKSPEITRLQQTLQSQLTTLK